jgi:hypothetical protein
MKKKKSRKRIDWKIATKCWKMESCYDVWTGSFDNNHCLKINPKDSIKFYLQKRLRMKKTLIRR